MTSDASQKPKDSAPRRRWFRFSLRTLLILTVVLSIALGWLGNFLVRIRQQQRIVARVEGIGVDAHWDTWAYVRSVRLWAQPTDESRDVAVLAELPRLERVSVDGEFFTDRELAQVARIPQLRLLALMNTSITSQGIDELRSLPNLEVLHLYGESIDDQALRTLSRFSRIRLLSLQRTSVTSSGFTEIQNLTELRDLAIGEVPWELRFHKKQLLDDDAMPHIGKLERLETLSLFGTAVSDRGLRHLRGLQQLNSLEIRETDISDNRAKEIANLHGLKQLSLGLTKVGNSGLHELAKLPLLENLNVAGTLITDEGVTDLLAMSNLRSLDVSLTKVSDMGLRRLIAHPSLEELEFGPDNSPELLQEFKRDAPRIKVIYNDPSMYSLEPPPE